MLPPIQRVKRPMVTTSVPELRTRCKNTTENALLARRKVIRLLIAVIGSFAFCVLPYHVRVLWQTWGQPEISFASSLYTPLSFLIYYLNAGLNPILYGFLSNNFRRSLIDVLCCRKANLHPITRFSSFKTASTYGP